jgi:hypothetical protein
MTIVRDGHRAHAVGISSLATVAALGACLGAWVGCGGEAKPADSPPPAGSATPSAGVTAAPVADPSAGAASTAAAGTTAAPAPAAAGASPLSTVLTTDPQKLAQMYAAANGAAVASSAPTGGPPDAAEAGLKALAGKQAAGMKPDGPLAKGTLQEGGHLEMMVTLQAGKCYSILGYSPVPGVKDLDLHLLAPPLYNVLSGEDTTDDNTPIVAKFPNPICPVVAVPLPYKVDIFAEKGAGAVAVQLYSKAK